MIEDTIDEYLTAARFCLCYRKPDKGCLGGPAALLLFCVVDILGQLSGDPDNSLEILNRPPFSQGLDENRLNYIKNVYRHALAHEANLRDYAAMYSTNELPVFRFSEDGDPGVTIALGALFEITEKAWEEFDRTQIDRYTQSEKFKKRYERKRFE